MPHRLHCLGGRRLCRALRRSAGAGVLGRRQAHRACACAALWLAHFCRSLPAALLTGGRRPVRALGLNQAAKASAESRGRLRQWGGHWRPTQRAMQGAQPLLPLRLRGRAAGGGGGNGLQLAGAARLLQRSRAERAGALAVLALPRLGDAGRQGALQPEPKRGYVSSS